MNKIGKVFIILGAFLITISISLIINNKYEDYSARKKSEEALSIIKTNIEKNNQITVNVDSNEEIKEMETTNINGYDYIGTITIPSLNLELPIMSEYNYDKLKIAPCRYYGSLYTNDLIICGHSYKTHFRYLINLEQGDNVVFTDVSGKNYIYEVLEIEILSPKEVSKMIDNEFDLTLYTCTSDGLNRVTVRCNRVQNLV